MKLWGKLCVLNAKIIYEICRFVSHVCSFIINGSEGGTDSRKVWYTFTLTML